MDPYELFVRWYLRFNGFLSVENFVVHEPDPQLPNVPAGTESDTLAVRFPHSKEIPGDGYALNVKLINDEKLLDEEAIAKGLTDFVIAEVKSGQNKSLNKVWTAPDPDERYVAQVEYLVRWLGASGDEAAIREIARCLRKEYRCLHGQYLFRLVYFSDTPYQFATTKKIRQLTFRDVANFFVEDRISCWQRNGLGARSFHGQWHPLIKKVWELGGDEEVPPDRRIESILELLQTVKANGQPDKDLL